MILRNVLSQFFIVKYFIIIIIIIIIIIKIGFSWEFSLKIQHCFE